MRGQRVEFTEEDISYIIDNWGKESPYSMKKKFGCSWNKVCKIAEEHGLDVPTSNVWSDEEIELLKNLAQNHHYKEIAKIMGKSENAIYLKARKLGIVLIQSSRVWTKEEEQLLKDEWGNKKIETISKKMKRSIYSITVKATRMGLGSMINNNYDIIVISDLEELLNVSRARITRTWVKLGLNLKKKALTNNRSYYYVSFNDLILFLENNQNEWDSRNVEINSLGPEPDWLQEKRKRDLIENPLWYRFWTYDEKCQAIYLLKAGKSYQDIATILNRNEYAVATMIRNLGYSYMLPQYWKGNELKFLKDNYEFMTQQEIADVLGRTRKSIGYKEEQLGYIKGPVRTRNKVCNND